MRVLISSAAFNQMIGAMTGLLALLAPHKLLLIDEPAVHLAFIAWPARRLRP